jgi:hypothetical protein
MQNPKVIACVLALAIAAAVWSGGAAAAQDDSGKAPAAQDGARDFDWEFGTWKTRVRRLADPLSGAQQWLEYEGTSVVRPLLDGRANLVELNVSGPAGRIEGASLRLYNPQTRQWSLHYASLRSGMLTRPVFGGFRDGRGEFYGMEDLDGRAVLVRFVMSGIDTDTARFEQAYSADGGRTWETNWIAMDTRVAAP